MTNSVKTAKKRAKKNEPETALNWSHFSAMRNFLATFEPTKTLSQDAMATLLGSSTSNTYSKWERGDQAPPAMVCRTMELLLYYTLFKHDMFVSEDEAIEKLVAFKEITSKSNSALFTRAVNASKKIRSIQLAVYDCFCMMSGQSSGLTIRTDGYSCRLTSKQLMFIPGFNRNGRLTGNTLKMLSHAAGIVSQDYANMTVYKNDGTGIPQLVSDTYKANGVKYGGTIKTQYFDVRREEDDMIIDMSKDMMIRLNNFLAEAAALVKAEEAIIPDPDVLREELRGIVMKMPEAQKSPDGKVSLPSHFFTMNHCIGSNLRPKSRDINIIEKSLCHLLEVDPSSIEYPAAMLVRNAYGKSRNEQKKINTHFFHACIDERDLFITLKRPNALSALNGFLEGIVESPESKRDINSDVTLIRGRIHKIIRGAAMDEDNFHQLTSTTIEIDDILSRRGAVRVHLINALERLLLVSEGVYLTHTNGSGAVIKRVANENMLTRSDAFNKFVDLKVAAEDRARSEGWSEDELATAIEAIKTELKLRPEDVPTLEADCHFFTFTLNGDKGLLTFKQQSYVDAINKALASYAPPVAPVAEEDEDGDGQAAE